MKNIFRFLMAVAVLFTASCTKEDISSSIGGGEVEVTFTANLPELGTRAEYGTGKQVNKLRYYVYDNAGHFLSDLSSNPEQDKNIKSIAVGTPTTVNLVLLKGMTYNIVFWADHDGYYAYNTAAKTITVDYSRVTANDETRDAFYAYVTIDPAEEKAEDKANVTLRRPFAQLNAISTDDLTAHNNANIKLTESTVTLDVYHTFNIATGKVEGTAVTKTLDAGNVLEDGLISMNYFFASKDESYTTDVTLDVNYSNGASYSRKFTYVPLKQNYRTNIIGQLLSKSTDFTVTINPVFDTPDKDIVHTAAELQQQIENAQPGKPTEIVLGSDINLNDLLASLGTMSTRAEENHGVITIPENRNIVLDLNGKTVTAIDDTNRSFAAIYIAPLGHLTINDSKGEGKLTFKAENNRAWNSYSSVISNQRGTLVVNSGTIEHLGGTDMAYGIDNLTNTGNQIATTTINGGTVKSTYRAIRMFANSTEAVNSLIVNGGVIESTGGNKSIWLQEANANANPAALTVAPTAQLKGDVLLSATASATEWPVEVSIASAALQGESTVAHGNYLPAGYSVVEENDVWTVKFTPAAKIGETTYNTLEKAVDAVQDGETIVLQRDITFTTGANNTTNGINYTRGVSFTLDLNKKTISSNLGNITLRFKIGDGNDITDKEVAVAIKNGTVISGDKNWCAITAAAVNNNKLTLNLSDLNVKNYKGGDMAIKSFNGGIINATNVNVTSTIGGGFYAAGGEMVLENCTVNQNGQTSEYMSVALGVSGGAKMTVKSGNYSAISDNARGNHVAYVMSSGGNLIIDGGTFSNVGDNAIANNARAAIAADAYAVVTINDGTFNAQKNILWTINNLGYGTNPKAYINGGNFSSNPCVYDGYVAPILPDGKAPAQGANGRWTLVDAVSTAEALVAALTQGGVVTLGADIALTETAVIAEGKSVVLDLNGKTLAAADKNAIRNDGGNLTIKNGTVTRTGDAVGYSVNNASGEIVVENATITRGLYTSGSKLTATNANISHDQSSRHAIYAWNCEVTLNSGTYHNDNAGNATLMASGSSVVVINGGTFSIADGRSTLGWTSSMFDQNSTANVTIKGGLFNGGFRINSADTVLTVEGGEFNTNNGSGYTDYSGTVSIKGGTYTDDAAKAFAKKHVAEGYEVNANGEVVAKVN